jgi:radical SAM superfamily enzyme YgiQ (UPF0313 family)
VPASPRVLCVFPRYEPSFGTFQNAYPLMGNVRAFMPPQGILVIAAYLPKHWEVRFVDENMRAATAEEFAWADAVFVSGMHIQRRQIESINERAHRLGKTTVLGGPSVSGAPEWYPGFDYLHVGELGDATDLLIAALEAAPGRPAQQVVLTTNERVALAEFPIPAYERVEIDRYFIGSVQFSSGCPYRCEFCDIPELYGRNPRLKTPEQVTAELDAMLARGNPGAVYFVDDNFVGNRKAAAALLPHLVEWQRRNGFPVEFACEATLNIAKSTDLLALMRDAYFTTVFCGIETPEPEALHAIAKDQNNALPILEAVDILNSYGLEVVSGIIMGLDTDTLDTGRKINEFIESAHIPIATINLLHALPKTPLWRRLEAEGRLVDGAGRESNVEYLLPYDELVAMWRACFSRAYEPEAIYGRFAYNTERTYPNRVALPNSKARVNAKNIRRGLRLLANIVWNVGIRSDYRRTFWEMALPALRRGDIAGVLHVALVSHHLITFSRECAAGVQNASFYHADTQKRELAGV